MAALISFIWHVSDMLLLSLWRTFCSTVVVRQLCGDSPVSAAHHTTRKAASRCLH
jgi:hypothetical protein